MIYIIKESREKGMKEMAEEAGRDINGKERDKEENKKYQSVYQTSTTGCYLYVDSLCYVL